MQSKSGQNWMMYFRKWKGSTVQGKHHDLILESRITLKGMKNNHGKMNSQKHRKILRHIWSYKNVYRLKRIENHSVPPYSWLPIVFNRSKGSLNALKTLNHSVAYHIKKLPHKLIVITIQQACIWHNLSFKRLNRKKADFGGLDICLICDSGK